MTGTTAVPAPGGPAPVERLVLDLGGVVFPSVMSWAVAELERVAGVDGRRLREFLGAGLRRDLWSGRIGIPEFRARLGGFAGVPPEVVAPEAEVRRLLSPLVPPARIRRLAARVPVTVLSNHREEWAVPALERTGLAGALDPLLISSRTRRVKPDADALAQITELGVPPPRVLIVDDRPGVLRAAEAFGLATLEATGADWIDRVEARLAVDGGGAGG